MNKIYYNFLLFLLTLMVVFVAMQQNSVAAEQVIKFRPLKGTEPAIINSILQQDYSVKHFINLHEIDFPQDVHIAKADMDDTGQNEILLLIKRNGAAWDKNKCIFQIWKRYDEQWKIIGLYAIREEELHVLAKKHNGFHELSDTQGVIPWYEWKEGNDVKFKPIASQQMVFVKQLLLSDNEWKEYIESGELNIQHGVKIAYADLDGDGKEEIFLYIYGLTCGTAGCPITIWRQYGNEWKNIGTASQEIIILRRTDKGFHQIYTWEDDILHWNGTKYVSD